MQSIAKAAQHRSGFTLIELLVITAIIAIMTATLFPVFAGTRKNARRSQLEALGRHLEGENYAFADGHVKWLSRKSVRYNATTQDIRFSIH